MKTVVKIALLSASFFGSALPCMAKEAIESRADRSRVCRGYISYNITHLVVPPVRFFSNPQFSGEPVLLLNEDGLFLKGKEICEWGSRSGGPRLLYATTKSQPDQPKSDQDEPNGKSCNSEVNLVQTATAGRYRQILYIFINSINGGVIVTEYKGRRLYIDKKTLTDRFGIIAPDEAARRCKITAAAAAATAKRHKDTREKWAELEKTDRAFSKFMSKLRQCGNFRCVLGHLQEKDQEEAERARGCERRKGAEPICPDPEGDMVVSESDAMSMLDHCIQMFSLRIPGSDAWDSVECEPYLDPVSKKWSLHKFKFAF